MALPVGRKVSISVSAQLLFSQWVLYFALHVSSLSLTSLLSQIIQFMQNRYSFFPLNILSVQITIHCLFP